MMPSFFPRNRWLKYVMVLVLLAIAIAFFSQAQAQTTKYFSDHGTLTVSPDSIVYEMGHRSEALPNVLLAQHLPRMNEYQYVAHDIALLVDNLALKGVDVHVPPSPLDTLRNAVDSLTVALADVLAENAEQAQTINQQAGTIDSQSDTIAQLEADLTAAQAALAPVRAERDRLAAEYAYAVREVRELIQAIRNR